MNTVPNHRGKRLASLSLLCSIGVLLSACTPDTTRQRVQDDVASTFINSYKTSLALQGKTVQPPTMQSTECHSSVNKTADSGPGSWGCELKYLDAGGKKHDDFFVVLVDALGCYQAFNGDNRDATIIDNQTHQRIPDPAVGFDGCYNVYDSKNNTAK